MVLEDVTELWDAQYQLLELYVGADISHSDYTGSQTKLPKILLNGNNICMVCH